MPDINFYCRVIGIEPDASLEKVKEAHRTSVQRLVNYRFSPDPKVRHDATEKIKELNEAYEKIKEHLWKSYQQDVGEESHMTVKNSMHASSSWSKWKYIFSGFFIGMIVIVSLSFFFVQEILQVLARVDSTE